MNMKSKLVAVPGDIPHCAHYAIIVFRKTVVHHPAQGHGYDAYNESVTCNQYFVTSYIDDWHEDIKSLMVPPLPKSHWDNPTQFVAFVVSGVAEPEIHVNIKESSRA